jgi:hypothetical protein
MEVRRIGDDVAGVARFDLRRVKHGLREHPLVRCDRV